MYTFNFFLFGIFSWTAKKLKLNKKINGKFDKIFIGLKLLSISIETFIHFYYLDFVGF